MKISLLFYKVSALILLLACNKDTSTNTTGKSNFSCLIDDKSFVATSSYATIENTLSDGVIQIIGQKGNDVVELVINEGEAKDGAILKADGGVSINGQTYAVEQTASVTITKRTATQMVGTFTMEAVDDFINPTKTVKVTQGKFDVIIQ